MTSSAGRAESFMRLEAEFGKRSVSAGSGRDFNKLLSEMAYFFS